MNQLPLDCIVHIMQLLPIQQVFVCMSVNKKWQEAACYTVRKHKRVLLLSKHILYIHVGMRFLLHAHVYLHAALTQSALHSHTCEGDTDQSRVSHSRFYSHPVNTYHVFTLSLNPLSTSLRA